MLAQPIGAIALTAPEGTARINAWRAENGIPAVAENTLWSSRCALHNAYMLRNQVLAHEEDPSRPGYTSAGNEAGQSAILTDGFPLRGSDPSLVFWGNDRPFATAPLHLADLMNPRAASFGYAEATSGANARLCITTTTDVTRSAPPTDTTWSVPGDGVTGVVAGEVADEYPFVPEQFVGVPIGTRTGPHLYVYAQGPTVDDVRVRGAKLTGSTGERELRFVDRSTPTVGDFLPLGAAILIPVRPLDAGTTYHATVTLADPLGGTTTRAWSFTTAGTPALSKPEGKVKGQKPIPDVSVQFIPAAPLQVKVVRRWRRRSGRNVLIAVNAPGGLASFGVRGGRVALIRRPAANHPNRFRVTVVLTRRRVTVFVAAAAGGHVALRVT